VKISIDWLSISLPNSRCIGQVQRALLAPYIHSVTGLNDDWQVSQSRKPFNVGFKGVKTGVMLYGYHSLGGALLECTGKTMDTLERDYSALVDSWLTVYKITRIDIACDYEQRIAPSVLCANIDARTIGKLVSDTGETIYIGSSKSDKFVRCYLYNAPHERANSTRVEFVYRRDYATKVARFIASGDVESVVGDIKRHLILRGYDMRDDWNDIEEAKIKMSDEHSRDIQKTLKWLKKQVSPSIQRLLLEGVSQDTILSNLFGFLVSDEDVKNE